MLDELNRKLAGVREKMEYRRRLEASLESARQTLSYERSRLPELEAALKKESADVERLESLGLRSLFHAVLGSKERQLEQERQEYLAASLKHHACVHAIAVCEREIADLEAALSALGDIDALYRSILHEKERAIAGGGGARVFALLQLSEDIGGAQAELRKLAEAIEAGEEALADLENLIDALESAEGWGRWDLIGGGEIVAWSKRAKIDEAREYVTSAQDSLRRFRRELADVGLKAKLKVKRDSFDGFADSVFDRLVADWVVQHKVEDSLERAKGVRKKVRKLLKELNGRLDAARAKAATLQTERHLRVEDA